MPTTPAPVKPSSTTGRRSNFNLVLAQLTELCESLEPGDSIPSHSALARRFEVSEFSVLRALDELRRNGTIIRRQGASTIVAERTQAETAAVSTAGQTKLAKSCPVVGVVGRFAPEISELLVPYIIGQSLEHALAGDKSLSLKFFDCFRNVDFSVSYVDGARSMLTADVDALCVISPDPAEVDAIMATARRSATPVIFLAEEELAQPVPQVYIDHRYDGYQAANYYLQQGFQEALFIMLGQHYWARERLAGVRAAFLHAGFPAEAVRVFPHELEQNRTGSRKEFKSPLQTWVREQMEQGSFTGAIIAANDHLALDVLEVADRYAPSGEREFAILGFDDKPESNRHGLTTFRPPHFDMGKEGARLLTQLLKDGEIRGTSLHSRLSSQLVERSSTLLSR